MAGRLNVAGGAAAWLPRVLIGGLVALLHLMVAEHLPVRPIDAGLPPRLQVVYLHELAPVEVPVRSSSALSAAPLREVMSAPEQFSPPLAAIVIDAPSLAASQPVPVEESAAADDGGAAAAEAPSATPSQLLSDGDQSIEVDDASAPSGGIVAANDMAAAAQLQEQGGAPEEAVDTTAAPPAPGDSAAFEWPVSTRLSYVLGGYYRGEVNGSAQVEWINAAPRYQVNLDVTVGLSFAPLFTRRMRSDGRMVAQGLQPEHYAEASQLAFRAPQHASLRIDADGVQDARGRRFPARARRGSMFVQDSASQFVQLSWLFTVDPALLTPGRLIEFDLALPRRVARWAYQVGEPQTIHTPFGPVEAVHVQPRPGTERGSDLLAQAWFAPSLANLPVRIRIEQSADVYLDLVLERRPEIAAR